jgi:hypothetical protein
VCVCVCLYIYIYIYRKILVYQFKISNRFAAVENVRDIRDKNGAWEKY